MSIIGLDTYLDNCEQCEVILEVIYPSNNKYLFNKTNIINTNTRFTKAILTKNINWISVNPSINKSSEKYMLELEDISIITAA
ncbi:3727_t:CDS:2, partial [Diversispora eburnea]